MPHAFCVGVDLNNPYIMDETKVKDNIHISVVLFRTIASLFLHGVAYLYINCFMEDFLFQKLKFN